MRIIRLGSQTIRGFSWACALLAALCPLLCLGATISGVEMVASNVITRGSISITNLEIWKICGRNCRADVSAYQSLLSRTNDHILLNHPVKTFVRLSSQKGLDFPPVAAPLHRFVEFAGLATDEYIWNSGPIQQTIWLADAAALLANVSNYQAHFPVTTLAPNRITGSMIQSNQIVIGTKYASRTPGTATTPKVANGTAEVVASSKLSVMISVVSTNLDEREFTIPDGYREVPEESLQQIAVRPKAFETQVSDFKKAEAMRERWRKGAPMFSIPNVKELSTKPPSGAGGATGKPPANPNNP